MVRAAVIAIVVVIVVFGSAFGDSSDEAVKRQSGRVPEYQSAKVPECQSASEPEKNCNCLMVVSARGFNLHGLFSSRHTPSPTASCHTPSCDGIQSQITFDAARQSVRINEKNDAVRGLREQTSDDKELKRRKGRAFLRSILIPGWGQLAEGKKSLGYAFLTTEVLLISGVIGFNMYSSWLEDDYRTYAAQHAGVTGNPGHQFYVEIGNWMDRRSFNERRLQFRQYDELYSESSMDWSWDSDAARRYFRNMRIDSDQVRQNSMLLIGGLILNHFVAAIEAGRGIKDNTTQVSVDVGKGDKVEMRLSWCSNLCR